MTQIENYYPVSCWNPIQNSEPMGAYQNPGNMMQPLDQETMQKLCADFFYKKNELDYQLSVMRAKAVNDEWLMHERMQENIRLQQLKHESDMELLRLKNDQEEKIQKMKAAQVEGMQRRAAERERATVAAVLDSKGFFCVETFYSETKKEVSNPVLRIADLKMVRFVDCETSELVGEKITWNRGENFFLLYGDRCTPESFMKNLEKQGEVIAVPGKKKKTVSELIYAFIIKQADVQEIPSRWGWNKTFGGWLFARDGITTSDLVRKGNPGLKN